MRSLSVRLLALLVVPVLVLTACGGDSDDDGDSGSSSAIDVTGDVGEEPKVDIPKDYSVDESATDVVEEGDGDEVKTGDEVMVQIALYNGASGDELANMFAGPTAQPQPLTVDDKDAFLPGLNEQLEGQTVGSRLLVSITPEDGFGKEGNPQIKLGPDDTMVALVDLVPEEEQPKATGTVDDVSVKGAADAKPTITFDKPLFVDKTESKVISEGDGAEVKPNDTVSVDYIGVNGRTGKEFDSSYDAKPADFPLVEGQMIPGFITGLVGQKIGSRVLVTIPRDDGYGPAGNSQAGIEGTDSLVFVVDLHEVTKK